MIPANMTPIPVPYLARYRATERIRLRRCVPIRLQQEYTTYVQSHRMSPCRRPTTRKHRSLTSTRSQHQPNYSRLPHFVSLRKVVCGCRSMPYGSSRRPLFCSFVILCAYRPFVMRVSCSLSFNQVSVMSGLHVLHFPQPLCFSPSRRRHGACHHQQWCS